MLDIKTTQYQSSHPAYNIVCEMLDSQVKKKKASLVMQNSGETLYLKVENFKEKKRLAWETEGRNHLKRWKIHVKWEEGKITNDIILEKKGACDLTAFST